MPRKILIVDDNAINRKLLINTLQKDYDILEAENGKEALALMNRNYKILSAVLLDIVMPELDGYEVLRCAKDNPLLAQIPVIMVTGSEDEDSRVKALSLGANDFILKPFNPEIVKHCLKNNIALRETASILNAIQKDKLTGLYNREAFFEKVGALIKDREPGYYTLSCFDIDNFKLINDQYGAAEGDRILHDIGKTVRESMERIGGIASRISADNFAGLFPTEKQNTDILQKMQDKDLAHLEQQTITFSFGRYVVTDLSLPASAIYDRAYIAKQSIKGRYDKHLAYFDEKMLEKLVRDQQIISEMETALQQHQFEVWFQPQYNHVTGALIGAEALARWRHPQKGIVPPGEFIPLFEQNGFIYELDKYVWREVCRYLRKWLDEGADPQPVSMNISRYDIFRPDLVDVITGYAREFDIPIDLLRLEITESAFSKSTKAIVAIVKQLIALGFIIEIDDFGSGYSSLNTLKSVPAQVVKLDMRFLEDDDDSQRGGNILESIVRMTKWLGVSVIAEGVETKEQGDYLKSIGCSQVQGYLYARPMPAEAYEAHCRGARGGERLYTLDTVENLDNNAFWNPNSLDTLIFNSYVGAACVFEYHNGHIEIIRATDKYARMLGGDGITVEDVLKLDVNKHLDRTIGAATLKAMEASAGAMGEATDEFLFVDLPGCPHETYLRSTLRVIASTEDRFLVYCISENITAQRLSERKERRVAKQLHAVMESINCGITAVLAKGDTVRLLLANDQYYELLGYTRRQYRAEIGERAFDTIYPDDRARVQSIVEEARATGESTSMEYRALRRGGEVVWLRSFLSMTSFDGVEGKVQLCTYTNVTAEKHASQTLLDNIPCGAGICAINGDDVRMTYINKRYYTYFKHNIGLQRTASVFDVIHPDDRATLRAAMVPAMGKGGEGSCVVRIMDAPGEYIPFRLSGVAVEAEGSENTIYVTFVPLSSEELSFSEMIPVVLAAMMASSSDLAFVKDKNLRYICCSRAFAHMVHLESEKDVVGKTDYDLFDPALAEQYVADDHTLMESGESIVNMTEHLPSAEGKMRFSSTSKYLLRDSVGNVLGLYGVGRDITRARETELRQQFLINCIPGGVAVYEGTWGTLETVRLTYYSDGFCRLYGYSRDEYERLGMKNPTGLVAKEHIPELTAQIDQLVRSGTPIDYIYRARIHKGGSRWIHVKAVLGERNGDNLTANAVFLDVTPQQEALEHLRVSEEENRLAIRHSGNAVCRYDIASRSLQAAPDANPVFEMPAKTEDVPYEQVRSGGVSPETADAYIAFYESILRGEKTGSVTYQRKSSMGWRWVEAHFSTIFDSDGTPVSAVISFADATESYAKEAAYIKWQQSLKNKKPGSYALYRCNVSRKTVIDNMEGELLNMPIRIAENRMEKRTAEYAEKCLLKEDAARYIAFLDPATLLDKYRRGDRTITLDFREVKRPEGYRWLRLTVDLVECSHSADVEAYLLFEDIDEAKRAELRTKERAETDPLTGLLNRAAFAEQVDGQIRMSGPHAMHALLMLDIDGFKQVNDVFGHGAGDQALIELAGLLRTILRRDDLVARLGGDEFMVFLCDIPQERIAANKAKQICELSRKAFGEGVHISGSVGIAVCPSEGDCFEALYQKADETLYYVKNMGRDNYAFYHEDMKDEKRPARTAGAKPKVDVAQKVKRRMLVVDDNKVDCELMAHMFEGEFIIEKARDGAAALKHLRHYGAAISVVLLDLMMPGMDGFAVLEQMQQSAEVRGIPVVVVSGDEKRETSLRAIRAGATDFVTKPVNPDILRIRVQSAISKAENERLRAENTLLERQSDETARYKTVLDRLGLAVVEMDAEKGTFVYGSAMGAYLAGTYDGRTLWHVLLSDGVADAHTVEAMQQLVHDVADTPGRLQGSMISGLKTPSGQRKSFCMHAYKLPDAQGRTDKMILTFSADTAERSE